MVESTDSNLQEAPAFWSIFYCRTSYPTEQLDWTISFSNYSTKNLDIDCWKEPLMAETKIIAILQQSLNSENEQIRRAKKTTNGDLMQTFEFKEEKRTAEEAGKIGGLSSFATSKKTRSIPTLAWVLEPNEYKTLSSCNYCHNFWSFKEFFELFETAFLKPSNITFEL